MDNVVKLYWELRAIAENNGDEVAQVFSVPPHESPATFFSVAFNEITMTLELLDYYNHMFGKQIPTPGIDVSEARTENAQRIMKFQKTCFIEIMSSFEFSAKKIARENTATLGAFSGRIYLRKIMMRSFDKGLMDEDELNLWTGAIEMRNSLVHNNGISDETACYQYPDITIEVKKDAMTQGKLNCFGLLMKWLLNSSMVWILRANGR